MDNNKKMSLIIAIAGFLHDIGKFIQRIQKDSNIDKLPDNPKYQPEKQTGYSHIHATYTEFFINNILKDIPEIKDKQKLADIAARHHIESNNVNDEYFVLVADRISAGIDRKNYADNATEIPYKDWTKTRLISVFDELDDKVQSYEQRRYEYGISCLDESSIIPKDKDDNPSSYQTIASEFYKSLETLPKDNLKNWFIEFDKLNKLYTSFVPSATVEKVIPDISLYDHAKTTSAIAQALYVYHQDKNDFKKANIKDENEKKFIYLTAKFNGIQNFIFSSGGETNKNAAKILRGRSFYISLMMKKLCTFVCDSLSIAHTAVVINAAGSATFILPNTLKIKDELKEIKNKINDWLIEKFYGEVTVSFANIEISIDDLKNKLSEVGENIAKKLESEKYNKIPLNKIGVINNYFKEQEVPCKYCGKRPAKDDENRKCNICEDLINIGNRLSQSNKQELKLKIPIFNIYDKVLKTDYDNLYVPKNDKTTKDFEQIIDDVNKDGINVLGVLKADIDNLGLLFFNVSKKGGISRRVTFSRLLDAFWTLWLPKKLEKDYPNIYTVFSGGDDLFLIGQWKNIIDFALDLKFEFNDFVCNSPLITFSAGIAMLKPGQPINNFYELSEVALDKSKDFRNKNALTLFNTTVSWNSLKEDLSDEFVETNKDIFNNSFSYKLLNFIDMAEKEYKLQDKINHNKQVDLKEMQNFKWRALLFYYISKSKSIKENIKQKLINYFSEQISDNKKRNILKISIYKKIYLNRTRRK